MAKTPLSFGHSECNRVNRKTVTFTFVLWERHIMSAIQQTQQGRQQMFDIINVTIVTKLYQMLEQAQNLRSGCQILNDNSYLKILMGTDLKCVNKH